MVPKVFEPLKFCCNVKSANLKTKQEFFFLFFFACVLLFFSASDSVSWKNERMNMSYNGNTTFLAESFPMLVNPSGDDSMFSMVRNTIYNRKLCFKHKFVSLVYI